MVIGKRGLRLPLGARDTATAVVLEIRQAVQHEELVVDIGLGQVSFAIGMVIKIIGVADQSHVGLALFQPQRFREAQPRHADLQRVAIGQPGKALGQQLARNAHPPVVDPTAVALKEFGGLWAVFEPHAHVLQDPECGFVNLLNLICT